MTPCEKLDYNIKDRFIVVSSTGNNQFSVGDIVQLFVDDGTNSGFFRRESDGLMGEYFYPILKRSTILPVKIKTFSQLWV